jgi:Activator of Hsp90 ATPase, N-terminal/Tetratricopeptide repeat
LININTQEYPSLSVYVLFTPKDSAPCPLAFHSLGTKNYRRMSSSSSPTKSTAAAAAELSLEFEQATAAMELGDAHDEKREDSDLVAPSKETAPMDVDDEDAQPEEDEDDDEAGDPIEENDSLSTSSTASTEGNGKDEGVSPQQAELILIKATGQKEIGNTEFKSGDYDKAARSYRRGVNALKKLNRNNGGGDAQVRGLLVTLYTNLSTVSFKQNKFRVSAEVAAQAVRIDPANVKALYRRAVAERRLGNLEEARADLRAAIAAGQDCGPDVAVCKKELAAIKRELDDHRENQKKALAKAFSGDSALYDDKEDAAKRKAEQERLRKVQEEESIRKRKVEWEDDCVKRMANNEPAISFEDWEKERREADEAAKKERRKRAARKAAEPSEKDDDDDDEDQLTEAELRLMRGYKKTADGRTTSYFTRELSEEEKNRIGDTAPKRLDSSSSSPPVSTCNAANDSDAAAAAVPVSKWNQAGTWEEKDTTSWCSDQLRQRLMETTVDGIMYKVKIASVDELTGDASVAVVGGKKRYIFDFHAKAKYEIKDDGDAVVAKGVVRLPDICSTHHDEIEVLFDPWKKAPKKDADEVTAVRETLAETLRSNVQLFVQDFNAMY